LAILKSYIIKFACIKGIFNYGQHQVMTLTEKNDLKKYKLINEYKYFNFIFVSLKS